MACPCGMDYPHTWGDCIGERGEQYKRAKQEAEKKEAEKMRNEIEINGVKLTREQLEDAVKRLNAPEVLSVGTRLKLGDNVYRIMAQDNLQSVADVVRKASRPVTLLYNETENRLAYNYAPPNVETGPWEKIDG